MRKVCLLNRVSVRSQISRDKNNFHDLTKEETLKSRSTQFLVKCHVNVINWFCNI